MPIDNPNFFLATDERVIGVWEECWERILQLTHEPLFQSELCVEAARLVCIYRSPITDRAIDGFSEWVADAQQYVYEQIAIDPAETAWHRLNAVLAGARVGISPQAASSISRYLH